MSFNKLQPHLNPENPQAQGQAQNVSSQATMNNQIKGTTIVNTFVPGAPNQAPYPVTPYIIPGHVVGGGNLEYNVFYKNISYSIRAKSPLNAAEEGYIQMRKNIPGFSEKKNIKIHVQRKNENRRNQVHDFLVKIAKIKNPKYSIKIIFKKL